MVELQECLFTDVEYVIEFHGPQVKLVDAGFDLNDAEDLQKHPIAPEHLNEEYVTHCNSTNQFFSRKQNFHSRKKRKPHT